MLKKGDRVRVVSADYSDLDADTIYTVAGRHPKYRTAVYLVDQPGTYQGAYFEGRFVRA